MHNTFQPPANPLSGQEIDVLLEQTTLVAGDVHWHRTGGGECSVAEYEGVIQGENVFLHLMSLEMSNYWIVTWPERGFKGKGGIKLTDDDLTTITKKLEIALKEKLTKGTTPSR